MIYLKDNKLQIGSPGELAKVFRDLLNVEDAIDRDKASDEDRKVARNMFEAGQILGIKMLDRIISTKGGYFSFRHSSMG